MSPNVATCKKIKGAKTRSIEIEQMPWKHSMDPQGIVFLAEGRLYRAIHPHAESHVKSLFTSGLIEALNRANLIPRTTISDRHVDGMSNLVLEHETISPVVYQNEWCFEMLRRAALVTLDVNSIARKYGYQTHDAHCYNILFDGVTPKFVDLTSLIPIHNSPRRPGWKPYGEFMQNFYYPLRLWSSGAEPEARRSLIDGGISPLSWRMLSSRLHCRATANLEQALYRAYFAWKGINTVDEHSIRNHLCQSARRRRWAEFLIRRIQHNQAPFSSVSLDRLRTKVERIAAPCVKSFWMDYHKQTVLDHRFQRLVDLLKTHQVRTITDIGGNAGFFCRAAVEHGAAEEAICIDYDSNAINSLYNRLVEGGNNRVHPVVMNFRENQTSTLFRPAHERLASDAVIALALTHHLHISQGLSLDYIFSRLLSFGRRLIFVEHMPQGHYSSKFEDHPQPPESYSRERFRNALAKQCEILHEEELARNRTLFIGRKK